MNDAPELRCDPVTGRWVIIAPERARRPINLPGHAPTHRTNGERHPCPFCPGQEADTPNEVYAVRDPGTPPDAPGWRLRVVPNMYPAVRPGPPAESGSLSAPPASGGGGLFASAPAIGTAEVLIDCAEHFDDPTKLTDVQFGEVFKAYRARLTALAGDPALAHVAVFKNVGAEAGASLGHSHSQIVAAPVVPELLQTELRGAEEHFARTGRCVFCDLVVGDLADGARVVARSEHFVIVTAFAPRFAYEMWVLPVAHQPRYEALTDANARELAALLKRALVALDATQNTPAYNWFLHTAPLHAGAPAHYHWHLEVLPRTARPAGLEWGFGCHITTIAPESAAAELRAALPSAE
ncbi:MAG TPA: galactose-1-phosphate uridylyltransferase [Gemmata sp.]